MTMTTPDPLPIIETVDDIGRLVRAVFTDWAGLGDVRVGREGDLLMFSYTPPAQYAGRWNAFERLSRGLILHATTGQVIARPFDKFFNWGEGGRTSDAPLVSVMEKVDGSLIILYHHGGRWRAATRGAFGSEQAQWAQGQVDGLPGLAGVAAHWTLLAEAVYPANRIVIDYAGREGLVLLAMRRRDTGDYADEATLAATAAAVGLPRPATYTHLYSLDGIARALAGMSANEEGFVALFADGRRFKFKSAAYLELHKLVFGLSWRAALAAVRDGQVAAIRAIVPEELRAEFEGWVAEIEARLMAERAAVAAALAEARAAGLIDAAGQTPDRKAFAQWAAAHHPQRRAYLFAALESKPVGPILFRVAFSDVAGTEGAG